MVVDYASAASAITTQLTSALDAAMPILGMVVGCVIGIAFFIRISLRSCEKAAGSEAAFASPNQEAAACRSAEASQGRFI